jgi:hypothetical protein
LQQGLASGLARRWTALTLVSVPPIRERGIGFFGWVAKYCWMPS